MIYTKLNYYAMPFNKWTPYNWSNYILGLTVDKNKIVVHSKNDYSIIKSFNCKFNKYTFLRNSIYFGHTDSSLTNKLELKDLI